MKMRRSTLERVEIECGLADVEVARAWMTKNGYAMNADRWVRQFTWVITGDRPSNVYVSPLDELAHADAEEVGT